MRLFVAIPCDRGVRRALQAVQQRIVTGRAKVQWTAEQQLHLTVKFLGETPAERVPALAGAMQRAVAGVPAFHLEVGGSGCFPAGGPVRIIWVGGADPSGFMRQTVQRLEDEFAALGVPLEARTFSEHFTIGRVKFDDSRGKLREAVRAVSFAPVRLEVNGLTLYQSVLGPGGPQYTAVAQALFG